MKKIISLILICLLSIGCFSACGTGSSGPNNKKLKIVTTIFPEYDWVMQILGDKADDADVTMLINSGVDLHSFQPSADDMVKISTCDMFIYVGGESDEWVEDALANSINKNMVVINLLEALGDTLKEEEIVEGMEAEEEEESEEAEETEYDEHVWLSLKNAEVLCNSICEGISSLDSDNKDAYKSNTENYVKSLKELDGKYTDVCKNAKYKTLLFADRFPFRYMTEDYGLNYYAAFLGCSAESEASFETIAFLAKKTDELKLPAVITIEGTDHKIAETVISTSSSKSAKILTLDSMQSITSADIKDGLSYISIMEKNLEVIKSAIQ